MSGRDVLNLAEAAELLGVSPSCLSRHARLGEVPGRRIGKRWVFFRPTLMAWLAIDNEAAA